MKSQEINRRDWLFTAINLLVSFATPIEDIWSSKKGIKKGVKDTICLSYSTRDDLYAGVFLRKMKSQEINRRDWLFTAVNLLVSFATPIDDIWSYKEGIKKGAKDTICFSCSVCGCFSMQNEESGNQPTRLTFHFNQSACFICHTYRGHLEF
jgi:DNA-binding XRE family transcriptional regulator